MKNNITLSIGVIAYNEESNIKNLILNLINNTEKGLIKEIIVISDGSTDRTVKEIKSIKNNKVKTIIYSERKGKSARGNGLLKIFKGDVLILFDADIIPKKNFTKSIIKTISNKNGWGIIGCKVTPLPARTFFEKIINFSVLMKHDIYNSINNGNNIFQCHGRVRVFSREFSKNFKWKVATGEDAFSYLSCINSGYSFHYESKAEVFYRSPQNFKDHVKQSARFSLGPKVMSKYFDSKFVKREYEIPLRVSILKSVKYFLRNPIYFMFYFAIYILIRTYPNKEKYNKSKWQIAESSKTLNFK